MKDLPVFTTETGVSSLGLSQIPCRGDAYITVRSTQEGMLQAHIKECADFCRMAGAKRVYLSGAEGDGGIRILELRGIPSLDPEKIENIFPVTEQTVSQWREIVNRRLKDVDLAACLDQKREKEILSSGGAYFIHRQGSLLGVGWLTEGTLRILASVVPGAGERVAHTILSVTPGESIRIEVASTNHRALRLYEKLGFLPVKELEAWTLL